MENYTTNWLGKKIFVNPLDQRGKTLVENNGILHPPSNLVWDKLLTSYPWDLIVDVGANYGEFILSSELPQNSAIRLYEPNTLVLPYLKKSLEDSGIIYSLHEKAISDFVGSSTFFQDEKWSGTSFLDQANSNSQSSSQVLVSTLDEELKDNFSDAICLKIDIEGGEKSALEGAKNLLEISAKWAIMFEILHMPLSNLFEIIKDKHFYLFDRQTQKLVRVEASNEDELSISINNDRFHQQDGLIVSDWIHKNVFAKELIEGGAQSSHGNSSKYVVYTALMGNYEELNEQDLLPAGIKDVDFVCFTDNHELKSDRWEIVHVSPLFTNDSVRSSRFLKTMGHKYLNGYEYSLWVDNTVQLSKHPIQLINFLLQDKDIGFIRHSFRESLAGEFAAILELGLDDSSRVLDLLVAYNSLKIDPQDISCIWTGIIARKFNSSVDELMNLWATYIFRYSNRDQLSLPLALMRTGFEYHVSQLDNNNSVFHNWPLLLNRAKQSSFSSIERLSSSITIGSLQNRLFSKQLEIDELKSQLEQKILATTDELDSNLQTLRRELEEIKSSRSWKITYPLRKLKQQLRKFKN